MSDVSEATGSASGSIDALKAVFRSPNLRRLQLAWAGSNLGTWGYGIALAVYAYDQGGAAAVGLVALLRWIPAAIAAPFMGALGDRYPRKHVMVLSDLGRVVVITLAALAVFVDASPGVVYALAAIGVVMATAFRPAQAAITPTLVTTPEELTASNVVASSVESFGMFVGPAIGAVVLALSGVGEVFILAAVTFAWSAFMISRLRVDVVEEVREEEEVAAESADEPSFWQHATGGFRTILGEPDPRLLIGAIQRPDPDRRMPGRPRGGHRDRAAGQGRGVGGGDRVGVRDRRDHRGLRGRRPRRAGAPGDGLRRGEPAAGGCR